MVPKDVVEDELDNMRNDEHGTERVQMNIKAIRPLNVLAQVLILYQILVAEIPEERGDD